MTTSILWLEDLRLRHLPLVGGKLARLGEMACRGYPVPPGFALPVEAFSRAIPDKVRQDILRILDRSSDGSRLDNNSMLEARQLIEQSRLPDWLEEEICRAYRMLSDRCGSGGDIPVAVRSSGVSEDSKTASFAGQFDTYLGIHGATDVQNHIKRCWASQYTDRAMDYYRRKGLMPEQGGIAVGVMQLVMSRSSGIAFSVNPVSGKTNEIVIESSWGYGECIVSGHVTPDFWIVDKSSGRIIEEQVREKERWSIFDSGTGQYREEPVPAELRSQPSLNPDQVLKVAQTVQAIEQDEGHAQDMEWSFDTNSEFFVLQHRPVTTVDDDTDDEETDSGEFDPVEYALRNVFNVPPSDTGKN